jgi:hypothetical protein
VTYGSEVRGGRLTGSSGHRARWSIVTRRRRRHRPRCSFQRGAERAGATGATGGALSGSPISELHGCCPSRFSWSASSFGGALHTVRRRSVGRPRRTSGADRNDESAHGPFRAPTLVSPCDRWRELLPPPHRGRSTPSGCSIGTGCTRAPTSRTWRAWSASSASSASSAAIGAPPLA